MKKNQISDLKKFYSIMNFVAMVKQHHLICLNPGKKLEFHELNRTTRALNNKRNNYDLMPRPFLTFFNLIHTIIIMETMTE